MDLLGKAAILSELVAQYKDDEDWEDFFMVNDIGPSLAVYYARGLILQLSPTAERFIEESYESLLEAADREIDDFEYDSLDRLLGIDRAGAEFDDLKWGDS